MLLSGNGLHLGANEAPAIISAFVGEMTEILNEMINSKHKTKNTKHLTLDIPKIPEITIDTSDRNRTSPFAFTGNKFEFRALGSSANCATCMIIINAMVANQLIEFKSEVDKLMKKGSKLDDAFIKVLKDYINSSKNILFEIGIMAEALVAEAAKRGLQNIKNAPVALNAFINKKNINLFAKHDILTEREIHARYHIELENYFKIIQIESRILGELALSMFVPAVSFQNELIDNVKGIKAIFSDRI